MLTKNSFPLTHLFFMLPNIEKYEKLYLPKVFHRNKRRSVQTSEKLVEKQHQALPN